MKQILLCGIIALCLIAGMHTSTRAQGVYWESITSGGPLGDKPILSEMYYMPKKVKVASRNDDAVLIFRMDKDLLYSINTKEKTYSETTFSEMEKKMKQMSATMDSRTKELEKQLEGLPEEQRKMMEQMMGGKMPKKSQGGTVEVSKTGQTKTISGYSCAEYVLRSGGNDVVTIWATRDVKNFAGMAKDMGDFAARMEAMNPMSSKGLMDAMRKIDGFTIQTTTPQGITMLVQKIEPRPIPADQFEVPAGYKKVKSQLMDVTEE